MGAENLLVVSNGGVALPRTTIRDRIVLANFDDLVGWSAKNTDTENIALNTKHVMGKNSISFDKANTAADDVEAVIQNNINDIIDVSRMLPSAQILTLFHITSLVNIVNVFVRIGTDSDNYNQWTWPSELLKANEWNVLEKTIQESDFIDAGSGWMQNNILHVALGVTFKLQTNTFTNIKFDSLCFMAK